MSSPAAEGLDGACPGEGVLGMKSQELKEASKALKQGLSFNSRLQLQYTPWDHALDHLWSSDVVFLLLQECRHLFQPGRALC